MSFQKIILIFIFAAAVVSCKTKEDSVNSYRVFPLVPMGTAESMEAGRNRPPLVAIDGKVLLKGEMPVPLRSVNLALFKITTDKEEKILDFSSGEQGVFSITRELDKGTYEIRVIDQRYVGSLHIDLEKPLKDISFEIEKKK